MVDELLRSRLWRFLSGNLLFWLGDDSDRCLGSSIVSALKNGRFLHLFRLAVSGKTVFWLKLLLLLNKPVLF